MEPEAQVVSLELAKRLGASTQWKTYFCWLLIGDHYELYPTERAEIFHPGQESHPAYNEGELIFLLGSAFKSLTNGYPDTYYVARGNSGNNPNAQASAVKAADALALLFEEVIDN